MVLGSNVEHLRLMDVVPMALKDNTNAANWTIRLMTAARTSCRRHGDECATHCRGRPEKLKASYRQEQPRGFPIRATSTCVIVIFENVGTLHVQNKEFKRVLRKLHHNHFAWVHLTFMSKYRKTRLPMPCTAFSMWTSWGLERGDGGPGVRRTQSEK